MRHIPFNLQGVGHDALKDQSRCLAQFSSDHRCNVRVGSGRYQSASGSSGNSDSVRYGDGFEPVHGSAPDIAGQGIANPIGQIWSAVMMLEHLGHEEAAAGIVSAIEKVIQDGSVLTADMGGTANTSELGQAVLDAL